MIEDYSNVAPIVAGYSPVFESFYKLHLKLHPNNYYAKDINLKLGFPSIHKIKKLILEYKPDVVILRERNLYTIVCNFICKKYGIKTILYNQSPLWAKEGYFKHDLAHRVVNSLTPNCRITPVNQVGIDMGGKVRDKNTYFAPFVMQTHCKPADKVYFQKGNVNILEIGKYEKRKNHIMMVKVFSKLHTKYPNIRLTIVGEKSNKFHEEYYQKLVQLIDDKKLNDCIILKCNLSREEMNSEYMKSDIFVLASSGEPAAISHIEAMSYSIPAISGSDNGTADYISDGVCGYVFKDRDIDDLYSVLDDLLSDTDKIKQMGSAACSRIEDYCSFDRYYSALGI